MTKALWMSSNLNGVVSTAATNTWLTLTGTLNNLNPETRAQITTRSAGTFTNLFVRLSANSNSLTTNFNFRNNALTGNQTVAFATTVIGTQADTTNMDTTASGDLVDLAIVPGAGTGTVTVMLNSVLFAASSNTVTRMTCYSGQNYATTNTFFNVMNGDSLTNADTSETTAKTRQQKAGTVKNLYVRPSVNSNTNAVTYNSRIGGVNKALTVSITAGSTAAFEDTSNMDTVAVGDDYDIAFTTGAATVNYTPREESVEFISTANLAQLCTGESLGSNVANSTTVWYALAGRAFANTTAESNAQATARAAYTFSNLTVSVTTNGAASNPTLTFRKNAGAATNQTVSITAGVVGVYTDSTHVDTVLSTDSVNTQLVAPASSGITIAHVSVWALLAAAVAGFARNFGRLPAFGTTPPVFG